MNSISPGKLFFVKIHLIQNNKKTLKSSIGTFQGQIKVIQSIHSVSIEILFQKRKFRHSSYVRIGTLECDFFWLKIPSYPFLTRPYPSKHVTNLSDNFRIFLFDLLSDLFTRIIQKDIQYASKFDHFSQIIHTLVYLVKGMKKVLQGQSLEKHNLEKIKG